MCGKGATGTYRQKTLRRSNGNRRSISELIQKLKVRRGRRRGLPRERKRGLVECDVTGDDDPIGDSVKVAVSFMVGRVAKKDAQGGAGCELMASCGRQVGVAGAPKDAKVIVGRQRAMEGEVRGHELERLCGQDVE